MEDVSYAVAKAREQAEFATLDAIVNAPETRRFHTWPVLREQSVGLHSWSVAMLCWYLSRGHMPGTSVNLIIAALVHDAAEYKFGDMPGPVKRALPPVAKHGGGLTPFREHWGMMEEAHLEAVGLNLGIPLTPEEERILKMADAAEGCLYCIRERAMGNKLIKPCWDNFIAYYAEVLDTENEEAKVLYAYMFAKWYEAVNG